MLSIKTLKIEIKKVFSIKSLLVVNSLKSDILVAIKVWLRIAPKLPISSVNKRNAIIFLFIFVQLGTLRLIQTSVIRIELLWYIKNENNINQTFILFYC